MRLGLLCVCGTLLLSLTGGATEVTEGLDAEEKGGAPGCPVRFKPAGQCGDGDECPYQVTLPPLTIQLPKQFKMLEKTVKELQTLKETVNRLKSSCQGCKQQQVQRDSGEVPVLDQPVLADQGEAGDHGKDAQSTTMLEMQAKMNRMSNSLKNARTEITALQGRLEEMSLINRENVEAIVDGKVANITGVINSLNSKCSSQCPVVQSPQFILAPKDCSDYNMLKERKNGIYRVTPDPRDQTFEVYCDMESYGGGWTVVQQRLNGSVSFNRTWASYKTGFGNPRGEFWLGNDKIHLLTKAKDMILRIELEDFQGVREYAKYNQFYVSNEFLRYRLSVSGYSGTAGDALHFNKDYNHDQKFFTTPDKDNDMYPSGNCGAYYSSGWWFDACMSANLNGKYYQKRYKGISLWRQSRDGLLLNGLLLFLTGRGDNRHQIISTVRAQLRCNISVQPLDPHAFPDSNRAFITVKGTSADQGLKLDNFHVQYDDQNKELTILSEKVNSNVSVELTTPIKSDLYITTLGEGNVKIQKMECDTCRILTERGHCVLKSVKGHKLHLQSSGGNIIGQGTIHGNVDISTSGNSMVNVKKIQGSSMNVSTEHGPLKVKAIYAEFTSVSSISGKIELGHLHGDATVQSKLGDVIVDGSTGHLEVSSQEGDIDVYVGEHGTAELHSEQGAISVRVPASIRAGVLLSGVSVEISPEITLHQVEQESTNTYTTITALLNGEAVGEQWIKAQAKKGTVNLRTQSWFESLKLGQ
ncbi:hypothetical protein AAFF_G00165380 [Aldrovandia affinis]|uniref:Fibrinogen C-terminal domain-containing protein n=1 Tax=Aldrovandia affinis TaxID=143900 RepID=A0AAD7RMC5_9TELE|nr:hypothetical protein AAFF_G00165380 [Aldrovandia affinis]